MAWGAPEHGYATSRRQEREAQRRKRELERQAKEQAKLSEIEQARLEVSRYENRLEVLLSIHKEQGPVWDWHAIAASLSPPEPQRHNYHELAARQTACLSQAKQEGEGSPAILDARLNDEKCFQQARRDHAAELARLANLTTLARGILAGNSRAYKEVLTELSPFGEISDLGTALHFRVHSAELVEVELKTNGTQVIPTDVKSLTSTGKLSVKRMPRVRFHEIYQDYICGCILRVAREVFALLPVSTVLITASAEIEDMVSGCAVEQAVLSAALEHAAVAGLDFDRLDPSDTIDTFPHRGDFKATRKAGAFAPIAPLSPENLKSRPMATAGFDELFASVRRTRQELRAVSEQLSVRQRSEQS